jgi:hypothetical protein
MKIFEYEINDGLENIVKASASVCYSSIVQPSISIHKNKIKNIKSLASANDADLYYVQSILVSSSWNKNDDIFDKVEIWQARNTPEDKPTNLEHDEHTIIGHIISNWPITDEGQIIDDNTDINDLPEKYHILTGSVIYKAYSVPELQQRAQKLIAEIEEGNKYVSMECLFGNFDYGLINKSTGEYKILPRNEESSYLTKYLRAYGGQGEYDNYKIGRVLRNITFSGKGFVDKPANPDSVIFTKNMVAQSSEKKLDEKIEDLSNTGVSNNQLNLNVETIIMSSKNTEVTASTVVEENTKTTVATPTVVETVEVAEAVQDYASELESLKQAKEEAVRMHEEASKMHEEAMKAKTAEHDKMKQDIADLKKVVEHYMAKDAEMTRNALMNQRKASLVELGVENETAEAAVQKLEHLDDNTFAFMTSLFASSFEALAKKKNDKKEEEEDEDKEDATQNEVAGSAKDEKENKDDKEEDEDTKKSSPKNAELGKKSKSSINVEALETAEVDNSVSLSVGGQVESAVESTRAALVEFISNRLGKKL